MKFLKQFFKVIIRFYQKYLTILSFGSCRYHPTCSHYALMQIEQNDNIFSAIFYSIIRILKCNPLFDGGFDYPIVKRSIYKVEFKKIRVKYWLIPKDKNKYFVLQYWKYNNQDKFNNGNQ